MSETRPSKDEEYFLVTLFLSEASLIELESLEELGVFNFRIVCADRSAALIECCFEDAVRLIRRTGGSFKIARVLGNNISDALTKASLPFEAKFNWTVSAYECSADLLREAREELHDLLKSKGLGKSKFLEPEIVIEDRNKEKIRSAEIKSGEVYSKILAPLDGRDGIDLVLHGNLGGKTIYGETIETSDFQGYDDRDFMRPQQDPTKTVSPRIARMLVNLATTSDKLSLLDPFCGLGTILQEALLCGHSVVGIDRDQNNVEKSKENLQWTKAKYKIGRRNMNLFAYDARRLSRARMPPVDAIASEPILLPIFKTNPSPSQAKSAVIKVEEIYERCVQEFSSVLSQKKRRFAITTPVLIDSSGRRRLFSLEDVSISSGFRPYRGRLSGRNMEYPLGVETTKKRIVQRAVSVYYVS
ncbi:MAG: TRM11 family SAM-dependent methyltransferase [Nitrososphaerales archaeon]